MHDATQALSSFPLFETRAIQYDCPNTHTLTHPITLFD